MIESETNKSMAFARFAQAHPRYKGGLLVDCFYDEACDTLGIRNISYYMSLDPNDPCWDKVAKEGGDGQ